MSKKKEGKFQVLKSVVVSEQNEFHLFGKLREGNLAAGWFINIPLNAAISVTIRVTSCEEVETPEDGKKYTLLTIPTEADMLAIFAQVNLEKVYCAVSADGEN
jgi:hypothetical protein